MRSKLLLLSIGLAAAALSGCGSEATSSTGGTSSGGAGTTSTTSAGGGGTGASGGSMSTGGGGGSTTSSSTGTLVEPTPLAGGYEDTAGSLALGPTDVYWANVTIFQTGGIESGVKKTAKAGGEVSFELAGPWAYAIAVDATNLYWADGPSIQKKALGGGTPTLLAKQQGVQIESVIAVDDTSVYWANRDLGTVMKVAKDGAGGPVEIAADQVMPMRVAVDDTTVYWTNSDDPGAIMSAPKAGGPATIIASNQPFPQALAVGGDSVYWSNAGDFSVMKAPKAGGAAEMITSGESVPSIALDATHVYWLRSDWGVLRAPIEGGPHVVLSVGQTGCSRMALDDGFIYWTRAAVVDGAKVLRLPK